MGRQMPWDDIPDSNMFPTGFYHVEGIKLEETVSSPNSGGKLMFAAEVRIVEHGTTSAYTGMHIFNNFVIGSDEDPEAQVPGTWAKGFGRSYKQMIAAAQIAEQRDTEKQCASFPGTQFIWGLKLVVQSDTNRDGTPNQFAGSEQNNPTRFYKIGAKEPGIEPKKKAPGVAAAPAAPIASVASVAPVAAAPAPAAVPPAVPPTAPAAIPAPAPATPATPPPAAPAAPAPEGAPQMLPCNICGQSVEAKDFAKHINMCLANQAVK